MVKRPTIQQPRGAVHFTGDMFSDGYFLHRIEHSVIISASFGVSIVFHGSALLCQTTLLKLW